MRVVNSYAATSEAVCVSLLNKVDYTFINLNLNRFDRTSASPFRPRGNQPMQLERLRISAHQNLYQPVLTETAGQCFALWLM